SGRAIDADVRAARESYGRRSPCGLAKRAANRLATSRATAVSTWYGDSARRSHAGLSGGAFSLWAVPSPPAGGWRPASRLERSGRAAPARRRCVGCLVRRAGAALPKHRDATVSGRDHERPCSHGVFGSLGTAI